MTTAEPTAAPEAAVIGPLTYLGVAGAIVGGFLPWVEGDGYSLSAWDVSIRFMFGFEDDIGGPKIGVVLLVSAFALLPVFTRTRLSWRFLASMAAIVTEVVGFTVWRVRALTADPSIGLGAIVTLAAALLLAVEAWQATQR